MEEKTDGFKFAITLLTAFATLLYVAYIYVQNYAITTTLLYDIIFSIINIGVTISGLLLIYVWIKGMLTVAEQNTMPVQNYHSWEKIASFLYLFTSALLISLVIKTIIVWFIFETGININNGIILFIITFFIFSICLSVFLYSEEIQKYLKKAINRHNLNILGIVFLFFLVYLANEQLSNKVTYFIIHGGTTIDMNDIYSKNDSLVPVSIKITGLNNGTDIILFQKNFSNYLAPVQIDQINMPKYDSKLPTEPGNNSILVGNAIDNEKYTIFIDTSTLPVGYYELLVTTHDKGKNYSKIFYLENNSNVDIP